MSLNIHRLPSSSPFSVAPSSSLIAFFSFLELSFDFLRSEKLESGCWNSERLYANSPMDIDSQRISEEFPQSPFHDFVDRNPVVDETVLIEPPTCAFCRRILIPDNEDAVELEMIDICGDCKFLFLEDIGTPAYHRTTPRARRTRHSSSESTENLFSQQFTHMINLVRQSQSSVSGHEDRFAGSADTAGSMQHSSSHTTPDQSRRWRQLLSDSEIDGFDSLFGESDSNFSFGPYRHSHGDSDAVSFRTYGGNSDASLDGHSFLDTDIFIMPGEVTDLDSDTDIDPMRAGISNWNSSDEEDEDDELTEADIRQDALEVEFTDARTRLENFLRSSGSGRGNSVSSREHEQWIGEHRRTYARSNVSRAEVSESQSYVGDSGDYLDPRDFEVLLEHLAETNSMRRGAPPAAVSYMKNLPRSVICEEHLERDDMTCAICKDVFIVGVVVNQLPCLHLYHPSCILPWLSARNSCPLCRYELPTDDKDYEEGKQNSRISRGIHGLQHLIVGSESPGDLNAVGADDEFETSQQEEQIDSPALNNSSGREGGRGQWFFAAAAPIVGIVGVAIVLWLSNSVCNQEVSGGRFRERRQLDMNVADSSNQRENRSWRWWSFV